MKKIFTLLGVLLMGASIVKAEQQTMTVEYYWEPPIGDYVSLSHYEETNYAYDVNITYNEVDGVYTIDNFLSSGYPLSFTIGRGISTDSHTFINFVNNVKSDYASYGGINTSVLIPDTENPIMGKIVKSNTDNSEIDAENPIIFNATDETYVHLVRNNVNGNYEAFIVVDMITGYTKFPSGNILANNNRFRLTLHFNGPEPNATPLTIKVMNEAGTSESNLPYNTTLAVGEDGIYTISNFLDSTQPMSFTFDPNDPNDNSIAITLKDNVKTVDAAGITFNYLTQFDGKPGKDGKVGDYEYISHAKLHTQGEARPTEFARPNIDLSKSYLKRVDKEENNGCNYFANFYVKSGSGLARNLQFYFEGPEKSQSGLSVVEVDNSNAPVEYYNLNGQRVENPANGIFVRKQGSKVEKVVIR